MADAIETEEDADNYLLEDGSGYYLLEQQPGTDEPMPFVGGGYYPQEG